MSEIVETGWQEGYIPSDNEKSLVGQGSRGLLAMQNITLDDKGVLRAAKSSTLLSAALGYQINSIYAALINSFKLRYSYDVLGNLRRNYGASNDSNIYDLVIGTGGTTAKAVYLQALGHVFMLAGTRKFKDRQDLQWALGIPVPTAPTVTNNASALVDLTNLATGAMTNWTNVESSVFSNTGDPLTITPNTTTNRAITQTVYSSVIDTTNFGGGTGFDTPDDLFTFKFEVDDPNQLSYFKIDLFCADPSSGVTDEFWTEIDYAGIATNTNPNNPYIPSVPFTLTPGVVFTITIARSNFQRLGTSITLGWTTIKAARLTVGTFIPTSCSFGTFKVGTGAVLGDLQYVCVEVNDTGQYVEYSPSSTVISGRASTNFVHIDRSGTAVNSQCNGIRFYRNDVTLGQFIEIARQTGARGFTPAAFNDSMDDTTALENAAIDSSRVLQFYRTTLPNTIVGAIYFATRVVYLTTSGFFPSYSLDPGTYDSRYFYELTGTQGELCLFIAKLDVGTFVVATTKDFYRVTGTFSLNNVTLSDGTVAVIQDVTITPLGISDPAVNRAFVETDGSLMYVSATGIRTFNNASSTLINTTLDLLFKGETRFGQPAIKLQANDLDFIACATAGTRVYWSLPCSDGNNYVFVNTFNPPAPTELRGASYWRQLTEIDLTSNPSCMVREDDGTIIFGSRASISYVKSLESGSNAAPIHLRTQLNFGQNLNPKQCGGLRILINTGGVPLTYILYGELENGTIGSMTGTITTTGLQVVNLDPHSTLGFCLAFALELTGTTATFFLSYIIWEIIQELPPIVFYAVMLPTNFDSAGRKRVGVWPFEADLLGNPVTAVCTIDGTAVSQNITNTGIQTQFWNNYAATPGIDHKLEVISALGMRFFKFEPPKVIQEFPVKTYYAIMPYTNLGSTNPKRMAAFSASVNPLGNALSIIVSVDGRALPSQTFNANYIDTVTWFNTQDILGTDWQVEVFAPGGMEFYKFEKPTVLQTFPAGKEMDQMGPFDLDQKGLIFGFRLRVYPRNGILNYIVYDGDTQVYSDSLTVTINQDDAYIVVFPKGINPAVCRMIFSSAAEFFRFSFEVKVRKTGKETEEQWLGING